MQQISALSQGDGHTVGGDKQSVNNPILLNQGPRLTPIATKKLVFALWLAKKTAFTCTFFVKCTHIYIYIYETGDKLFQIYVTH